MSTESPSPVLFDAARAATYDEHSARIAPLRDPLLLITRLALAGLPPDAHVLCVGVGTGIELVDLAQAFPGWHFTGVEPAPAMLAVCRKKVEAMQLGERCVLHEGYLDSLPPQAPFDAATAILVSQFQVRPGARVRFFAEIAARLRPGGALVSADLATGPSPAAFDRLFALWGRALSLTGISAEQIAAMRALYGRDVAVVDPAEVARIIADAGFDPPVQCYQGLLIHGWYTTRVR